MKKYLPGITVVLAVLMVASYFPSVQRGILEGVAWADSKVSALTQKTTPPNPTTDWLYFIDMTEATAANRSKKIAVQDLLRPKTVWVNNQSQFTTVGGDSVYQINLANGNVYMVDTTAIYASGSGFGAVSGITIIMPAAVSGNSNVPIEIRKADSGVTPVEIWAYTADGTTFQNLWVDLTPDSGETEQPTYRSGVSVWDMETQGDVRAYRMCPDPESEVSAWPTYKIVKIN